MAKRNVTPGTDTKSTGVPDEIQLGVANMKTLFDAIEAIGSSPLAVEKHTLIGLANMGQTFANECETGAREVAAEAS